MNRKFLTEAIADARAVKESAIANAKVALEESFSPQITSMFASRLAEMEKEEMKENEEVNEKKGFGSNKPELDEAKKDLDEAKDDLDEAKKDLDEGEDLDESFEAILRELEEMDLEEGKKDLDEAEGEEDDTDDETEDEEIDLDNMTEEDLKKFIEGVIEDMVESGELEPADDFEDDVDVDVVDGEIDIEDDSETAVDESYGDIDEAKKDLDEAKKDLDEAKKEVEEAKSKEKDAKKDLKEAVATINILKKELNEINILNAKLLYANRIFKDTNVSGTAKVKILEAFDKAETVKEAKLVFEALSTSTKSKKKNSINEVKRRGSASNLAAPKSKRKNSQRIMESDIMVQRFQKLAGIIK